MNTRRLWAWMVLLASFAFVLQLSTSAKAQDDGQDQSQDQNQEQNQVQNQDQGNNEDQDPPGRVARLNFSQGSISFRPAGEDDWVTGVPNRPMVTGDDLWADQDSRAEVHIGSTAIRLGAKTGITFLTLDDRTTQIRLAEGSLIVRVRHVDDDDNYEIDTPNIAFSLLQPGEYRIDVSEDGSQSITTVWHGRGRVTGGGFNYTVVAGQSATFNGTEHVDYDLGQIPARDDLDSWAFERDDREDRADSANYVSREMTGYEDLDEYGDWSYVAGYGPCWRPRAVVVGWAPYRFGHWVYVGPWGWTWVEDEPWGFAPFHYGRWASVNGGWFWVPGPVVVRPVWAPALVAFVGGGPGFHFSAGVGVGWFPLAPGEVYLPGYHVSRRYVNNVNITNTTVSVTKVTNVYNTVIVNRNTTINRVMYVNQHVNNGVTVVSHEAFVNARPVAQNVMRIDQREIAAAPVSHVVAAEPVRTSVFGAGRPAPVKPPSAVISRPVVAVRTPPPPPNPIEQRQSQAGGHLNQQSLVRPVGPTQPAATNQMRRPVPSQDGFRPFSQPNSGNNQVRQMPQTQPRVYEQQGTPQPENRNVPQPGSRNMQQPENRNMQPQENRNIQPSGRDFRQREDVRPAPQETHPLVRPAPAVQARSPQQEQQQEEKFNQWHQQRPASPPPQQREPSRAPEQRQPATPARQEKPKGR
jgi:FecR protein